MALKISSWVKSGQEELIPVCRANEMLNVNNEDKTYNILEYCDVQLCWNYLDRNYECYLLKPKYDNTTENYIYNLNNFQFSFRELDNSTETERIFTMDKNPYCFINYCGMYYVSDETGFALLHLNVEKLKIFYYDFEQQFSSTIIVQIPDFNPKIVKLCCRSIWIKTNIKDESYKGSFIDVVNINNKKEWYHIRSNICYPIFLNFVFSGIMLVADDFIDDIHEDCDEFYYSISFSSCKALYINYDNLIPYETNERNFIEFYKPKDLEMEDLSVFGIFKSTIILADQWVSDEDIEVNYCYFLSYNEKLQLRVCKRIDLSIPGNPNDIVDWNNSLEIIQQVGKMFVRTYANSVFVIDLKTAQVSQILEYPSCFYLSYDTHFTWSKHDRMLNIKVYKGNIEEYIKEYRGNDQFTHHNRWFHLKYGIFNGMTLKMLALNTSIGSFSLKKIQNSNLPHSLVREILNRKTY